MAFEFEVTINKPEDKVIEKIKAFVLAKKGKFDPINKTFEGDGIKGKYEIVTKGKEKVAVINILENNKRWTPDVAVKIAITKFITS